MFKTTPKFDVKVAPKAEEKKITVHQTPINLHTIKRSDALKKELPLTLGPKIEQVREFFLQEISPLTLSSEAGLSDALEILNTAIGSVNGSEMRKQFVQMVTDAASLKMLSFVSELAGLTDQNRALLFASYVLKSAPGKGEDLLEKFMSSMLKVSAVRGQKEGAAVPVRKVPADKARPARRVRAAPDTRTEAKRKPKATLKR